MKIEKIKYMRATIIAALIACAVNACAKNDEATAEAITAPSGLGYGAKTLTFAQNVAVSKGASVTGSLTSCSVTPALPTGLSLDSANCTISGTPTATQTATSYTVTGTNSAGSATASVKIAVVLYTATMQGTPTHSVGKTTFQIKITNSANVGQAGLNPKIIPEMDMGSMTHTTPVYSVTDNTSGLYTAEVYYLMTSSGGSWYIKTMSTDGMTETGTRIAITVGGANTDKMAVSSASDQYNNMGSASNRPYLVFIDSITGPAGNHTVNIFTAVRKSMMSHPALVNNLELVPYSGGNWNVVSGTSTIELSTDDGTTWPFTAQNINATGKLTFSSISGLTAGTGKKITFRVTVNGTVKGTGSLNTTVP